jgi:cytochrome P450
MPENTYTAPEIKPQASAGCPVTGLGAEFNPFEDPYLTDPYAFYARARAEEPAFYSPEIDHWVITRYEDVRAILHDPATFSSKVAQSPIRPWPKEAAEMFNARQFDLRPFLSNNDPPSHTHVRQFLRNAFTPRRIKRLEPIVRRIVVTEIDRIAPWGKADLVQELFYETPARVLFAFLGIPDGDVGKIKTWSKGRGLLTWGNPSDEEIIALMPNFIEYLEYCVDRVDDLEKNPGHDYTSELLKQLHEEKPDGVTKSMIVLALFGLLMAGHETTSNQASNGFRALLHHQDNWEAVCKDPTLIPNAVEEMIRYESSIISWRRVTNNPVEIAGVKIPQEAQLLVMLAAANRDSAHFEEGDCFDIQRENAQQHLSFGHGIHYCLGAPLARLELNIMLEELTRRLPSLRIVEGQTYNYLPNTTHRGPDTLWAVWKRDE